MVSVDFHINATRFEDGECRKHEHIGKLSISLNSEISELSKLLLNEISVGSHKDRIVVEEGHCASWDDGAEFGGLRYFWAAHMARIEHASDYGDCEIQFWGDEDCVGEPHSSLEWVSMLLRGMS